jgi:hypothetical protein
MLFGPRHRCNPFSRNSPPLMALRRHHAGVKKIMARLAPGHELAMTTDEADDRRTIYSRGFRDSTGANRSRETETARAAAALQSATVPAAESKAASAREPPEPPQASAVM